MTDSYYFTDGPISVNEPYYVKGKKVGEKFKNSAHILLVNIHALCQSKKGACIATTKYMSKMIKKSVRQVTYYLKYLKDTGQIYVHTSEPIRNQDFSKGRSLFYRKRIVQSLHDHKPDYYDDVNNIRFNTPKRVQKKKLQELTTKMAPKVRLHTTVTDYKGRLLGPNRTGKMTHEYWQARFEAESAHIPVIKAAVKPTVDSRQQSFTEFNAFDAYYSARKLALAAEQAEQDEMQAYIAARPPPVEPEEIDEEPEEGNELRDLMERLKKKRIAESEVFWDTIDEEEEAEKPIEFKVKLNLKW